MALAYPAASSGECARQVQGYASIGSDDHRYVQAATGKYFTRNSSTIIEIYGGFGYAHGKAEPLF